MSPFYGRTELAGVESIIRQQRSPGRLTACAMLSSGRALPSFRDMVLQGGHGRGGRLADPICSMMR